MTLAELLKNTTGQFSGVDQARPIRDDSAGDYGTLDDSNLSWIDYLTAKASDGGNALANLGRNLVDGFSPIGTSEQGNMALQVPPIVSGIAQSYSNLAGSPSHPGNAYELTGVPELDAPIQQDMMNALLPFYGGQAVGGIGRAVSGLGRGATSAVRGASEVEQLPLIANLPEQRGPVVGVQPVNSGGHGSRIRKYETTVGPHKLRSDFFPEDRGEYNFEFSIDDSLKTSGEVSPQHYPAILDGVKTALSDFIETERPHRIRFEPEGYNGAKNRAWKALGQSMAQRHGGRFETIGKYDHSMYFDPDGQMFLLSDTGKPSILGSAMAGAGEQPKGITAYHGSPHDFDKLNVPAFLTEDVKYAENYRDGATTQGPSRNVYQVRLNATPDRFKDVDWPNLREDRLYNPAERDKLMAELAADGFDGMRYRERSGGAQNYVVTNPDIIEILRKYGLAGATVGAGALAQPDQGTAGENYDLPAPPTLSRLLGYNPQYPGTY